MLLGREEKVQALCRLDPIVRPCFLGGQAGGVEPKGQIFLLGLAAAAMILGEIDRGLIEKGVRVGHGFTLRVPEDAEIGFLQQIRRVLGADAPGQETEQLTAVAN